MVVTVVQLFVQMLTVMFQAKGELYMTCLSIMITLCRIIEYPSKFDADDAVVRLDNKELKGIPVQVVADVRIVFWTNYF